MGDVASPHSTLQQCHTKGISPTCARSMPLWVMTGTPEVLDWDWSLLAAKHIESGVAASSTKSALHPCLRVVSQKMRWRESSPVFYLLSRRLVSRNHISACASAGLRMGVHTGTQRATYMCARLTPLSLCSWDTQGCPQGEKKEKGSKCQQKQTFAGTLSASWSRHGHTKPQQQY